MDVAVLKPMYDLLDAFLYDKDPPEGRAARSRLQVQHPSRALPDVMVTFFTRVLTSARPLEKVQAAQGGFVVHRPNKGDLDIYNKFVTEVN